MSPNAHMDKLNLMLHFKIFQHSSLPGLTHSTLLFFNITGDHIGSFAKIDLNEKAEPNIKDQNG